MYYNTTTLGRNIHFYRLIKKIIQSEALPDAAGLWLRDLDPDFTDPGRGLALFDLVGLALREREPDLLRDRDLE